MTVGMASVAVCIWCTLAFYISLPCKLLLPFCSGVSWRLEKLPAVGWCRVNVHLASRAPTEGTTPLLVIVEA